MSAWEAICREKLANARTWDQSHRANRRGVRRWARRLWWARWGQIVSGTAGAALGAVIGSWLAFAILGGAS